MKQKRLYNLLLLFAAGVSTALAAPSNHITGNDRTEAQGVPECAHDIALRSELFKRMILPLSFETVENIHASGLEVMRRLHSSLTDEGMPNLQRPLSHQPYLESEG